MAASATSCRRRMHGKSNSTRASGGSSCIASYARVSKLKSLGKELEKKVAGVAAGKHSSIEIILAATSTHKGSERLSREVPKPLGEIDNALRERKVALEAAQKPANSAVLPRKGATKRKRQLDIPTHDNESTVSTTDTSDAAQAETLLQRLNLQSSSAPKRIKTCHRQKAPEDSPGLPGELIDLVNLHAAFLKTLSLQYAHNGSNCPLDVRAICPNIAQAWGKRNVTVEDIRRCVGILMWTPGKDEMSSPAPFFLSNYGRGKICIECSPSVDQGFLREQKLNQEFENKLRTMWSMHQESSVQWFIGGLPKAVITVSATAEEAPALPIKSQYNLAQLRADILKKPREKGQDARPAAILNTDETKLSLLDRIRVKEHQKSQADAQGPTPAELERRAALQRAEDVAAVISMLTTATCTRQQRVSFPLGVLLTKLKDSLRNPISREDGAHCIRLLASEIVPQWLQVVTVGKKENVVVNTAFELSRSAMQDRVRALLS